MAPPSFVQATSYGPYEHGLRATIHALKYERVTAVSQGLGKMLAVAIADLEDNRPTGETVPRQMLVVPVPLHRKRQATRGFNQARTLAMEALKRLKKTHPHWDLALAATTLVRQRATETQAGLTPRERRVNLRGAFFVSDPEAIAGRHILLVDDILTTGATARACSRALVEAGAASVRVATLARAQRVMAADFADTAIGTGHGAYRMPAPEEFGDGLLADAEDSEEFDREPSADWEYREGLAGLDAVF